MKSLRYLVFALILAAAVAASCKNPALPVGATLTFKGVSGVEDGVVTKGDAESKFTITVSKRAGVKTVKVADDKGVVTYKSSKPAVAKVNAETGQVTIVAGGETTITATKAASKYALSTASYKLVVRDQKIEFKNPTLTVKVGESVTNVATEIKSPALGVEGSSGTGGAITYASKTAAVATVGGSTGEVAGVSDTKGTPVGKAVIEATKAAVSGKYKEQTAEYTITVLPSS